MPGVQLRRVMFAATIPVTIALVAWIVAGRALFGVAGWWLLIMMPVGALAMAGLTVTTVLAYAQRVPAEEGRLTQRQGAILAGLWISLIGFGFFLVDFGDTADSEASVFTEIIGADGFVGLSYSLFAVCVVTTVVLYVWLLVLLLLGWRHHRSQERDQDAEVTPR